MQQKFVGPYEVVAAFGNHTNQLERLGQSTTQNECCWKLYQACAERRRQALGILNSKGYKKHGKTIKTKNQPPRHPGKYIEGYYPQPGEQVTHLPKLVLVPGNDATNVLKGLEEGIKV